ncbi:MAG: hypothetical protein RIM23_00735 [Coleofasciculus sp. G3-WIS-01]|uniref:hypothetical protein n=1 Tax=Coleofasciculus sp. G3-WIS-01 TaxID=3069528 RepID=UPI0032F693E0
MSSPNQVPAYLRYLKARLQPLRQPKFWLSVMGFGLIVLFVWEYWKNPNWLSFLEEDPIREQFENSTDETPLSAEELAANMADIDSSAVLIEEFDQQNALAVASLPNPKSGDKKNALIASTPEKPSTSAPSLLNSVAEPKPSSSNPFAKASQEFLMGDILSGKGLFPNPNMLSSESSSSNSDTTSANAFQELTEVPGNEASQTSNKNSNQLTQRSDTSPSQTVPTSGTSGQNRTPLPTVPRTTTNRGIIQPSYPPASVPTVSNYNGAGQPTYPTGMTPNGTVYNGAGQPMYPSVPAPPVPATGVTNYPVMPTAPANSANVGQYPTQPNTVPSVGNNPTPITPGLQPSQLNRSQLNAPR